MKLAGDAGPIAYEYAINPTKKATGGITPTFIPASRAACYAVGMSAWTSTGRLVTLHRDVKDAIKALFLPSDEDS